MLCSPLLDTPARGLLDAYLPNLWFAGGLSALVGGHPWCINATNVGTSAATEIGFRDNAVNQAALLAHTGASGGGQLINHDAANPTHAFVSAAANRPLVVSSSAYLGFFQYDASNDALNTGTGITLGGMTGTTIFMRGKLRSTATTQILIEHSTNAGSNDSFAVYWDSGGSQLTLYSHMNTGSKLAIANFASATITTESVWCFRFDRSQTTSALQCVLFKDGVKQTLSNSTGETSPVASGNLSSQRLYTGARNGGSLFASLNLKNLVVYSAALSDSDCTAISALL